MGYSVDTAYSDAVAVVPSTATVYQPPLRALFVGTGAGTSAIQVVTQDAWTAYQWGLANGSTGAVKSVTFTGATTGSTIPVQLAQVIGATGASNLMGLY